jgi:hypothetical protein
MGMLADAGDEGMMFTTFCDSEIMDLAMVSFAFCKLLHRTKFLSVMGTLRVLGASK